MPPTRSRTRKRPLSSPHEGVEKPLDAFAIVEKCIHDKFLDLHLAQEVLNGHKESASVLGNLSGRDEVLQNLDVFLKQAITSRSGTSVYVCGSAGTGKSAGVDQVLRGLEQWVELRNTESWANATKKTNMHKSTAATKPVLLDIVHFNGNTFSSSSDIYSSILHGLMRCRSEGSNKGSHASIEQEGESITAKQAKEQLTEIMTNQVNSRKRTIRVPVVVVDEVDRLLESGVSQEVLYQLFAWPCVPDSNLILIGIANAVDLHQRFLPHLKLRNHEPRLLQVYPAYDSKSLSQIMRQTLVLRFAGEPIRFDLATVEIIARKLAKTGDARKAIDLCTRAIELARLEQKQNQAAQLSENSHHVSMKPLNSICDNVVDENTIGNTPESAVTLIRVSLKHASKALAAVFESPHVKLVEALPHQSQLALCAAVLHQRKDTGNALRVGLLFSEYRTLAKRMSLPPLSYKEFNSAVVDRLDQTGLVGLGKQGKSQDLRRRPLHLYVTERDVVFALRNSSTFSVLLNPQSTA